MLTAQTQGRGTVFWQMLRHTVMERQVEKIEMGFYVS